MSPDHHESSPIQLPELPPGWEWSSVEDLGVLGDQTVLTGPFGTSMGSSDFVPDAEGNVPVLTIGCLRQAGLDLRKAVFVRQGKAEALEKYRLRRGDLLFSRMATVGRAGIVERGFEGALFNYHLMRLRLEPEVIDPYFFVYFVRGSRTVTDFVRSVNHGMTRDGINTEQLLAMPVPVAPRRQQRRIVEAIESYFTRLDDAVATLERAQRNLKRYRASVLKAAVEGRLVPTGADLARAEGRGYEPASVLLERILADRRRRWQEAGDRPKYEEPVPPATPLPELPEGWCWASVDGLLREPLRNGHSARKVVDGDVRTLTLSAVTERDFSEANTKLTAADQQQVQDLWLEPGDIFVERSNTPELVGTAALYRGPRGFAIFPDLLIRVRPADNVLPLYVEAVLRSPRARSFFRQAAQGIAGSMPKISQETVARLAFPLPPIGEQTRIVAELERQLSVADEAEASVTMNQTRCVRLRQAILKWAFEGKLADQDPSDEPASALLERIRSQTLASRLSAGDTGDRRRRRGDRRTPVRAENKP